jgi:hypothetical protein
MNKNLKIIHQELQPNGGKSTHFIITELYKNIPFVTYIYKIPKDYFEPPSIDYEDVEKYAPLCPN